MRNIGIAGILMVLAAWTTTVQPIIDGFSVGRPITNGECHGYSAGWGCFWYGAGAGLAGWHDINKQQYYQTNPQWEQRTDSNRPKKKGDGRDNWSLPVPGFGGGDEKKD